MDSQPHQLRFVPRSNKQWLPLLVPMFICGSSWILGGIPLLTDVGFMVLTALCLVYLAMEFIQFPRRFGIGGMLLYGGVLIWFAHDYFSNWFLRDFNDPGCPAPASLIARVAFFYCFFIIMMVLGLGIKRGQWLTRLVLSVPEPGSQIFYLILIILIQMIGISAFFFTEDSLYNSLHAAAFGVWTGETVKWTVGRTGNLNYSWGGYVAQLIQVGQTGAVFASMFAIIISTKLWSKILCWCIWIFWTLNIFSGGRRGEMIFMAAPPIGMLFIKYQARAAMALRGRALWSYIVAGSLGFVLLVIVQVEGKFRDLGLQNADLSQTSLIANAGNAMFSEGLTGWRLIPNEHGFFGDRFFGEGFIRPIPEQIYLFLVGVIPRALWNDKPVDGLWEWYNSVMTGNANGTVGTTISHGLVGSWYFHYGLGGIVEGGLIVGWLMGICERSLQESNGRPIGMFVSLGMAVWLFRCYRDFQFNELYPLLAGMVLLTIFVRLFRPIFGTAPQADQPLPVAQSAYGPSYGV
jgi:hypothetical protein